MILNKLNLKTNRDKGMIIKYIITIQLSLINCKIYIFILL